MKNVKKSVGFKFLCIVASFVGVFSCAVLYFSWSSSNVQMEEMLKDKAELALQFDLAIRSYVSKTIRPFAQEHTDKDEFIPEVMSTSFVARSVFDKVREEHPEYTLKFSSDNPRNPHNQAGSEELKIIEYFNNNPDAKRWSGEIKIDGQDHIALFSARRMKEKCLQCHGDPKDAPASMVAQYGNKAGFHRPVGKVVALDTIAMPLKKYQAAAAMQAIKISMVMITGLALLLVVVYYVFQRLIGRKLKMIADHFKSSKATFGKSLIIPTSSHSNDEIDEIVSSYNKMAKHLEETTTSIDHLNAANQQLLASQQQLQANEQQLRASNQQLESEITEHKQAEELLQKNENQYRTLVENLPQRILLKDKNSVFVSCNESYAKALGMTSKDVIGKTDYDIYAKESADKYRAMDKEVMESRVRKDNYITLTLNDKEQIIHLAKTPVINDQDELIGVLCIFEDVTKQKYAEKEAKLAYEDLHGAHKELKNAQSQIIQNEKLASIGQLAAGVAHEINNPMGFVSSNFETMQSYAKKYKVLFDAYGELVKEVKCQSGKKLLDKAEEIEELCEDTQIDFVIEDSEGVFSDIQEGLMRITNIVQNLRDFSRIDQQEKLAECNLNDNIKSTMVVANNEIKYDANVKTDLGDLPPILCNSGQINQVFLNMLINAAQAIKLQKKKKGTINIKTYADGDKVICEIADNGPGIPPEKVSKIFDPFFTTKAPGKGTGLGLSVSYDIIVNKHKGSVVVDSTVGEGTKFTIKLPVKCEVTEESEIIQDSEAVSKAKC